MKIDRKLLRRIKRRLQGGEPQKKKTLEAAKKAARIREIPVPEQEQGLSKAWICKLLGIPFSGENEEYSGIFFAKRATEGSLAIISKTTHPYEKSTHRLDKKQAKLAMERGAKCLLCSRQIDDYPCLVVPEPAFGAATSILLGLRLRRPEMPVITVTGSIGKTTTTELIYTVMNQQYNCLKNQVGNANMSVHCVANLQKALESAEALVQEVTEFPAGTPAAMTPFLRPQAAVVTKVGTSHLEYFGTQENIAASCLGIENGLAEDGALVLNADDPLQMSAKVHHRRLTYGVDNPAADYKVENYRATVKGGIFDIVYGGKRTKVALSCLGVHNALDAAAAFAACHSLGMRPETIAAGLAQFKTKGVRQNLVSYGGNTIFVDCFNASRESIESALDTISGLQIQAGARRIAVLGDVKETMNTEKYHAEIGAIAAKSQMDELIFVGTDMHYAYAACADSSEKKCSWHETTREAAEYLKAALKPGDLLLVKGSRGMRLEEMIDELLGTWFREAFSQKDAVDVRTEDGTLWEVYPDHAVLKCWSPAHKQAMIPELVQDRPVWGINTAAFRKGQTLERLQLPTGLRNVREEAFAGATALQELRLPASVRLVDKAAFRGCRDIKSVTIESGCRHIGDAAFANCAGLESITIPESVWFIGENAFENCPKLTFRCGKDSYAADYARKNGITVAE